MFLKKTTLKELSILAVISIYAFYINWLSGNIGVLPIDSFGFLDTGHSILMGKLPIRDFWIFTGLLVDYMEAFFLAIFGNNWNSHLIHSSTMNIFAVLVLYYFLKDFKFKKKYNIVYCISFATLCYPVSGTPFAYIHSYIFSLVAIMFFILAIKNKSKKTWFLLPFICYFSFFSMQTPSGYILLILLISLIYYFLSSKDFESFKIFLAGSLSATLMFAFFLYITSTPVINFIYQYILFPLSIGEGRISSNPNAYVSFLDQINFKRLVGDFKFIHLILLPLIFLSFKNFRKKNKIINYLNSIFIISVFAFLFNQLITANQIYIFSLIPILAALLHLNIELSKVNGKVVFLLFFVVLFATIKFHYRYNVERKFHDLESLDKSKAINAKQIHQNLDSLKWLSKNDVPEIEVEVLQNAIRVIENDKREKTLITHYQFISTILDENLNILNRWYLWDNNTHPTENHKYFDNYKSLVNKNIKSNNVEVIYLLGQKNEIIFDKVKNYFTDVCFKSKTLVENKFSIHEIVSCSK